MDLVLVLFGALIGYALAGITALQVKGRSHAEQPVGAAIFLALLAVVLYHVFT